MMGIRSLGKKLSSYIYEHPSKIGLALICISAYMMIRKTIGYITGLYEPYSVYQIVTFGIPGGSLYGLGINRRRGRKVEKTIDELRKGADELEMDTRKISSEIS